MSGPEDLRLVLIVLGLLVAIYGVFRLWVSAVQRLLRQERRYDEAHSLRTSDGARVDVYRYGAATGGSTPVLLCHGVAANRYNLDLDDECSLACAIQRAGFDAWVVELRSGGRGRAANRRWGFDELWRLDMDLAVRFVLKRTGSERLHWVGYSMGGMLGYAYLQDSQAAASIASFVAVASPVTLAHGRRFLPLMRLAALIDWAGGVPLERLGRSVALFARWIPARLVAPLYHPDNLWLPARRSTLANLVADIPRALMLQLRAWVAAGGRIATPLRPDLLGGLGAVRTPALLIAGAHDGVAPPESVRPAYDALGSEDKRLVVVGRATGFDHDYGHADLAIGRHAPQEVFPIITTWLEEHGHNG